MKEYKVWAYVEQLDTATEEYTDLGEPTPIGEFDTVEEADAFVNHMSIDGEGAGATEDATAHICRNCGAIPMDHGSRVCAGPDYA